MAGWFQLARDIRNSSIYNMIYIILIISVIAIFLIIGYKSSSKSTPIGNKNDNTLVTIDNVSFSIKRGETLGLVGESGCGKTTTGRTILKLYEPTSGEIIFNGQDITGLSEKKMVSLRKNMQMIFQDPYASLNPRMTVGDIIGEAIDIHGLFKGKEREDRIRYLLDKVGLNGSHINRYAHEFSGGQRQRISLARALITNPSILILDDTTSAVDMETEFKIQQEVNLNNPNRTNFIIAHRISSVKSADLILVLENGRIIESGTHDSLVKNKGYYYEVYKTQFGDFNVSKEAI